MPCPTAGASYKGSCEKLMAIGSTVTIRMNQDQRYSYSREQLIEMLDKAMADNP